ncbi:MULTISPECIES: hypothetical protein [unclassified Wenzhouxiangella]|uniref:hypothetical protein n=1 Tax=unclassified Wenzhouxiangella TaxID=2613841 RepID=UPI0015F299EC|nr:MULTISPECIES: hypothetical protein [unclassified Wenzhouxiangella]
MTSLCIDELSRALKQRWGWDSSATHVPADADCPLDYRTFMARPCQRWDNAWIGQSERQESAERD